MRLIVASVACSILIATGQTFKSLVGDNDPTPCSADEQYLAPYMDKLVSYRDNPIANRFITLANLVDVVQTWLMDMFVPLIIPHSTLTIPMKVQVPIPFPVGPFDGIPPSLAHIEVNYMSINKLNEFKRLKPIKFKDGTRYTWQGHVIWKEDQSTTLTIGAKLVLGNSFEFPVNMTTTITGPGIDFGMIVAFDREKMCEVWGKVMQSSTGCASHPMFMDVERDVSGLKLTELTLHAKDFTLDELVMSKLPWDLDKHLLVVLKGLIEKNKPSILEHMTTSVSEAARKAANAGMLAEIPLYHKYYPCDLESVVPVPDVSEVCFNNNAAFAMKWGYANCPSHEVSLSTHTFPIDQSKCMAVTDIWPDAKPGQVLRGTTEAIAGVHEIIDPAIRYKPNSNKAIFQCSGSTLIYNCELISVVPINPAEIAQASQICILNQAGFVAEFDAKDLRTGSWVGQSDGFAINQRVCLDLTKANVTEGDQFQTRMHALAGRHLDIERIVEFKADAPEFTFVCRGSTMDYKCSTDVFSLESPLEV